MFYVCVQEPSCDIPPTDPLVNDHVTVVPQGTVQHGLPSSSTVPDNKKHLVVSNEQLADVLLKRSRSPNQLRPESVAPGKSANAPTTALKSPRVSRGSEEKEERDREEPHIEACDNSTPASKAGVDDKKELPTKFPRGNLKNGSKPLISAEINTAHQPLNQANSLIVVQSDSSAVDASAITDAVKKLKPRPKTMAPVGGTSSGELSL